MQDRIGKQIKAMHRNGATVREIAGAVGYGIETVYKRLQAAE
jgi:hypothetical protein